MDFDVIESTPEPKSLKCKIHIYLLSFFIYAFPFILGGLGVLYFDWFVGFFALCFGFIAIGIFQSKLRQMCLPPDQRERSLSVFQISSWFVLRYMFCEKID